MMVATTIEEPAVQTRDGITPWSALPVQDAIARLGCDPQNGLSDSDVAQRQRRFGKNTIEVETETRWYQVLGRQFVDVQIFILVIAA